jgi:predicted deacylase
MIKLHSPALNETINVNRLIGSIQGDLAGPCLIFIGGIHGNEPSGVFALHQVIRELNQSKVKPWGSVYALAGNLIALEQSKRFLQEDLNRMWQSEKLRKLQNGGFDPKNQDMVEQKELTEVLSNILKTEKGPFYFFDLHTTSSRSIPFLTVNDSLLNRKFTRQYPVPKILGIEEFLEGPLLSYLNELGYVSFGFESGQHDTLESIENHVAFIHLSMVFSGFLNKEQGSFDFYFKKLQQSTAVHQGFYEIYHRYEIANNENFEMLPGYSNFQPIHKGDILSVSNGDPIISNDASMIFMPLYQEQGDDGYFKIKKIPQVFLWLSSLLRKLKLDRILPFLPGVHWHSKRKDELIVNKRIAFLFTRQFLHLMGYRNKTLDQTHLIVRNRERASRNKEYKAAAWY